MSGSVQTTTENEGGFFGDALDVLEAIGRDVVEPIEEGIGEALDRAERGVQGLRVGVSTERERQRVRERTASLTPTLEDGLLVAGGAVGVLLLGKFLGFFS